MRWKIRSVAMIFTFFATALTLCGLLTCEEFEWWMIPTGIICAFYFIGFIVAGVVRARKEDGNDQKRI